MLIAFTGQKRSGKDSAARLIMTLDDDYEHFLFAGPLKAMIRTLFIEAGYEDDDEIDSFINGDRKEEPLALFQGKSTRHAMQTLGTEWRNFFGPNLWSDIVSDRLASSEYSVVTDMRFLHEEKFIDDRDGWKIRTRRFGQMKSLDPHPSEQEMESIKEHFTIYNYGSLNDLEDITQIVFTALNLENPSLLAASKMLYA